MMMMMMTMASSNPFRPRFETGVVGAHVTFLLLRIISVSQTVFMRSWQVKLERREHSTQGTDFLNCLLSTKLATAFWNLEIIWHLARLPFSDLARIFSILTGSVLNLKILPSIHENFSEILGVVTMSYRACNVRSYW